MSIGSPAETRKTSCTQADAQDLRTACILLTYCPSDCTTKLFHMRLGACDLHPSLKNHEFIIRQLGVDGMSSDESDYEELRSNPASRLRSPRYYVLNPQWRHPVLGQWLEVFDSVYHIRRRLGNELRGAYPRIRQHPASSVRHSSNKRFVSHLSISAYKPEWISSRLDVAFVVCPAQEQYSFAHPEDVFQ